MPTENLNEAARLRALHRSGLLEAHSQKQFEHITELVRDMLDVPTAIVSIVSDDKQVFAGHCGLPEIWAEKGETPLTHSFCKHVVERGAPMAVADALADPTLRNNRAIEDLGVVAYLGVPLFLPSGEVIGALAAISSSPREWGAGDVRRLQNLARIATNEIEVRVSELRWRTLFQSLQEGIVLGEAIRGPSGMIEDWRYLDVNPAWGELLGIDPDSVKGQTIRTIMPDLEEDWIDDVATVVNGGESVSFTRAVGHLGRWYDGVIQPLEGERFAIVFSEATDRVNQEARVAATLELGDRLRDLRTVPELSVTAAAIMGRALGASRAGFGFLDHSREFVDFEDWCAPGIPSIAGRHRMRDYGSYIDDLTAGRDVVIADVEADERTKGNADTFLALSIRVLINLPILEQGKLVAIAIVQFDRPRIWSEVETMFVRDVADRVVLATSRVEASERRAVLGQELAHRLKNTLAVVSAITTQTLRSSQDLDAARRSLTARIQALSKAHDILLTGQRDAATISTVIQSAVALHDEGKRVHLEGPTLPMGPKASMTLALIVHELATNSGKYGALSVPEGIVNVSWTVSREDGSRRPVMTLDWTERDGPPVVAPTRKGFGTRMIEMGLSGASGASSRIDYAPDGLRCRILAPLAELMTEEEADMRA